MIAVEAAKKTPGTRMITRRTALQLAGLALAFLAGAGAAHAKGPVLAAIKDIPDQGLYRETFSLDFPTTVEIEAVSAGAPDEKLLFSYPWLLDLNGRQVIWQMDLEDVEPTRDDNVEGNVQLTLPAGDYALYFSAHGGPYPLKKKIKFLKLFELGSVDVHGGVMVPWDRYGRPRDWRVVVRAVDEQFPLNSLHRPARQINMGEILAFRRVPSHQLRRAELTVREDVRLRILGVGEYWAREQAFSDGAWIEQLDGCGRIWEMTLTNTKLAGGAKKNRLFDSEVTLRPGRYLVCYATDATHAYDQWNMHPPFDPESWGLTISPARPIAEDAIEVRLDPPDANVFAVLDRMGDSDFDRLGFRALDGIDVCVQGLGEWSFSDGRALDYGWIEDARTLEEVWSMRFERGVYGGGEARNRRVCEQLHLPAGEYYLCYMTDYAHSSRAWANEAPYDPGAWGIALRGIGKDFSSDLVETFQPGEGSITLIQLAPMGNDVSRRVRFSVNDPTPIKIIALGEGSKGRMYDYGWLDRVDTGQTIWEMQYEETWHAGGAKKNRRAERLMTLEPGDYSLQYRSDGNHSFEGWNASEPENPHLWGVTLHEIAQRQ